MRRLRGRPSPATVIAVIALFVALGGTGYAAIKLPKNSVGSKQLKKNAVTGAKVKGSAITGAKVKADSLTGGDILESTLSKVSAAAAADTATKATSADTATKATTADSATTATSAENLTAPEAWHEVGTPGNPAFGENCVNVVAPSGLSPNIAEPVAFMKDKEGFVHLKGVYDCAAADTLVFSLPAGYRPANGKVVVTSVYCNGGCVDGGSDAENTGRLFIFGPGIQVDPIDVAGAVSGSGESMSLDGVVFRAAS